MIQSEEDKHSTSPSSSSVTEEVSTAHVTDQTVDSTTNVNSSLLLSKSSDSQANVIDSIINENTEEVKSDGEGVIKNCDNNDIIVSKAVVENAIPPIATSAVTDTDANDDECQSSSSQNLPVAVTENNDAINSKSGNDEPANDNKSDENAESIRNDIREIRSSLADAAREAADIIQDLGNLSQQ